MSDEQYEILTKMYSEQINKIRTKITEKEMKLYKNISYKKQMKYQVMMKIILLMVI